MRTVLKHTAAEAAPPPGSTGSGVQPTTPASQVFVVRQAPLYDLPKPERQVDYRPAFLRKVKSMIPISKEKITSTFEGNSGKDDRVPGWDSGSAATEPMPTTVLGARLRGGLRPAISTATVTVYPRHNAACSKRGAKQIRHCQCPKWIYENYNGTDRRYSAKTRSWNIAEKIRQEIEDSHDPIKAELKKLKETQQAKRIPISDAAESYFLDVAARHLADSTQRKHRLTVGKRLLPWSERNGFRYLDELTVAQLTKWRSTWNLAPRSSQIEKERVVTFFDFCVRQGFLERNPGRLLTRILTKPTPTDYFPRDEFEQLINATYLFVGRRSSKNGDKSIWPTLIRTMVLLMRWSGLRISDAVALERSRLIGNKILLYQHKTGQPVYVPLPHEVANSLRAIPPLGNIPNPRFFFRSENCNQKIALDRWHRCYLKVFKLADIRTADGTPKWCHSHMLRDTFAVELLLAGVPLEQVSILLGHASIRTTERHYAPWVRARQEQLEQSVQKAHAVQGITKSATAVANVPNIESGIPRKTNEGTAARSGSTPVDPKRSAAAKRAWLTIRAKRKTARSSKISESKSKAA
jgi:integrase/recombinase XerD